MADRQVGDETRVGFPETHHRLALLLDEAHRKAALAPVAPGGIHQRFKHLAGGHVADALQVVHQHAVFGGDLPRFGQVLEHAAGAGAEMRAARLNAVGRGNQHLQGAAFVEMAVAAGLFDPDGFAGKRAGDEDRLALAVADPAAVVAQVGDVQVEGRTLLETGTGHG